MIVIAHRGSSQKAPENTMPAIKKAIRDGADAVEVDVQLTKDQQVVVFHDEWVNRTTNGKGFICDLTYAELEKLDTGSWFHPRFRGTKIPLLSDVLDIAKKNTMPLHVELKNNLISYPNLEQKAIQLIQERNMDEQVIISSFKRQSLEICQYFAPHIRRGFLCWSTLNPFFQWAEWASLELYSIHPPISLIDASIKQLQQMGYKIFPYVIEQQYQLQLCIHYKVDGMFTNSPKRVKELLTR